MKRRTLYEFAMSHPEDLKTDVGLPAGMAVIAGLILPLSQLPAAFLTPVLGQAAFFVVPAALFGTMLAFGVSQGEPGRMRLTMRCAAAGFAIGAFVSATVFDSAEPGFFAAVITGAVGGFGMSLFCLENTLSRLLLTAATALSFSLVALIGFNNASSGCGG